MFAVAPAVGVPTQGAKRGGTIVVRDGEGEPACLNPLAVACLQSNSLSIVEKVLEPAFDVDARFRFRPRLVSGVTVSRRPPFTLTYHIRREARWSDGVPVTAGDFVFTHAAGLARASSLQAYELKHVRRVTAIDAKTVRVTLREPFSGWQQLFPNVLPRHVLEGQDLSKIWVHRIDDPKTGTPIGSGPFLVESLERGKALTLVRNPRYWGPHLARVDRLVIRYDAPFNPVPWLLTGDLDIAFPLPAPVVAPLLKNPDFRVVSPPAAGYDHLAFRVGRGGPPTLRNPLVRRAIAYGLDRTAIAHAVHAKGPLQSIVYLVQSPHRRPNWARYRPKPAFARALLARAGCKRGADGIFSCAGRRLSFRVVTSAGIPPRQVMLETIQAQLRRVGVEVVPTYVSPPVFYGTVLPRGQFEVALFGWVFAPEPASAAAPVYSCGGADNYTGYCSRSVSRALARASRTLDPVVQARILNAADRMIATDVPVVPLLQLNPSNVVRTSVKGFVKLPYNPYSDAENWWLDR
jgi:peptide/nickel transport system substrate-binding protein